MSITAFAKMVTGEHGGVDQGMGDVYNRWKDFRNENPERYKELMADMFSSAQDGVVPRLATGIN